MIYSIDLHKKFIFNGLDRRSSFVDAGNYASTLCAGVFVLKDKEDKKWIRQNSRHFVSVFMKPLKK